MNFSNFCAFIFNGFGTFYSALPSSLACWFYNETIDMFFKCLPSSGDAEKKHIFEGQH